eukprot:TRINITY_DN6255_c1_g1_i1.p1 TRINITY_DN6255_c1_g1~~TRINITY_DN6255_c1_g1_i1.p1  ORF type:complete len:268 (+),score=43.34 TRINITY_DN6255_c1_g1_i1:86-805(+)
MDATPPSPFPPQTGCPPDLVANNSLVAPPVATETPPRPVHPAPGWLRPVFPPDATLTETPCEVVPGLCIGGAKDVQHGRLVDDETIAFVVNCAYEVVLEPQSVQLLEQRGGYLEMKMEDSTHFDIAACWGESLGFIDNALRVYSESGGKKRCLIHCVRGRCRSATILLHALMNGAGGRPSPTLREGLRWLYRRRRGNVGINFGFFESLVAADRDKTGGAPSVTLDEYAEIHSSDDEVLP